MPGLLLVLGRSARTWAVDYRADGRKRRLVLGRFPELGLAAARKAARLQQDAVAGGGDPQGERAARKSSPTVGDRLDSYLALHVAGLRSARETRRRIESDIRPALGAVKLADLRAHHVVTLCDSILRRGSPVAANRTAATVRAFCGWLVGRGEIDSDPTGRIRKPAVESARSRVLSDSEISTLWTALDSVPAGAALAMRLLLLTGRRAGEVAGMKLAEIDFESGTWTLPAIRNKSGRSWAFPLAEPVLALLRGRPGHGGYLFWTRATGRADPAPRRSITAKGKESLDRAGVLATPWVIHDLRRTARTGMSRLGVQPHVAELCLGHVPGGVGAVYDVHGYQPEMRAAFELWASHVMRLVGEPGGNVLPLRKAG